MRLRCIAGVIRQFLIILPHMPLYHFDTILGVHAQFSGKTVGTDPRVAPVFTVAVPVGGAVGQYLVLRANHTVIMRVIKVFPPFMPALMMVFALGKATVVYSTNPCLPQAV